MAHCTALSLACRAASLATPAHFNSQNVGRAARSASKLPARQAALKVCAAKATYTIEKGDTLHRIGTQYGVSVADLKEANAETLTNVDVVYPGQTLVIPGIQVAKPIPVAPFAKTYLGAGVVLFLVVAAFLTKPNDE